MTLRFPGPRQQFVEAVDGVPVDHPLQHVAQIGVRLDVVEAGGFDQRAALASPVHRRLRARGLAPEQSFRNSGRRIWDGGCAAHAGLLAPIITPSPVPLLFAISEPDAYRAAIRWQDKSGSPVAIQAIDIACLSPCRMVGSRAAPGQNANDSNDVSGTVRPFHPSDWRR